MPQGDLLNTYKVIGTFLNKESYVPSRLTEFEIFVAFSWWSDHEQVTRGYLEWHAGCDFKKHPEDATGLLNNWNCAKALAADYIQRELFRKLDVKSSDPVGGGQMPTTEPDFASDTVKIWMTEKTSDVITETNAGWELWSACSRHGKISIAEARQIVRDKFPNERFNWDDVLKAFRKNGGKHTEKYLRKE